MFWLRIQFCFRTNIHTYGSKHNYKPRQALNTNIRSSQCSTTGVTKALFGVRHMGRNHSDSERGNRCRHMGYSFRLAARVLLYAPSYRQDSTYHGFVTPVVEHWLEREIAQWVHPMKDRSNDPSHHGECSTSELRPAPYRTKCVFNLSISVLNRIPIFKQEVH